MHPILTIRRYKPFRCFLLLSLLLRCPHIELYAHTVYIAVCVFDTFYDVSAEFSLKASFFVFVFVFVLVRRLEEERRRRERREIGYSPGRKSGRDSWMASSGERETGSMAGGD